MPENITVDQLLARVEACIELARRLQVEARKRVKSYLTDFKQWNPEVKYVTAPRASQFPGQK